MSSMRQSDGLLLNSNRGYEYLLKLIIVGDPDVGKEEILQEFETDSERELLPRNTLPRTGVNNLSLGNPRLFVPGTNRNVFPHEPNEATAASTADTTEPNATNMNFNANGFVSNGEDRVFMANNIQYNHLSDEQLLENDRRAAGSNEANAMMGREVSTNAIENNNSQDSSASRSRCDDGVCRTVTMLLDGKRVKIAMWTASGQGRFAFVLRSLARGAHGIVVVYDITSRYSFKGLDRWLKEVDTYAHGTPRVLVGNRLHLAFRRQVSDAEATAFAKRYALEYFEISPLAHNFNVLETFAFVCRAALKRTELPATLRSRRPSNLTSAQSSETANATASAPVSNDVEVDIEVEVPSLQELCVKSICSVLTVYDIARLPLPERIRQLLKSYAIANPSYIHLRNTLSTLKKRHSRRKSPRVILFGSLNLNLASAFSSSSRCSGDSTRSLADSSCTCSSTSTRARSALHQQTCDAADRKESMTAKCKCKCKVESTAVAKRPDENEYESSRSKRSLCRAQSLSSGVRNASSVVSATSCLQSRTTDFVAASRSSTSGNNSNHNHSQSNDKCCIS